MKKESFGYLPDHQEVFLYTLENEHLLVKLCDYGATLVSLFDKKSQQDLVLGFDNIDGYLHQDGHIGSCVGRVCNRIKHAQFILHDKIYHLTDNDHGNSLHGGHIGFDHRLYATSIDETNHQIIFSTCLKDGEDGYPGNMDLKITYTLKDRSIIIQASAKSDKDTLFGFTNHTYFNLDQSSTILDHEVKILSDQVAYNDETGCATQSLHHVKDTVFDFMDFHKIRDHIKDPELQLEQAKGYDHCYVMPGSGLRDMAIVRKDHLQVVISSDLPCMHFYTGNYLDNYVGKKGMVYPYQSGVCFEPEYFPNAINEKNIAFKPILGKDKEETQTICFKVEDVYPSATLSVCYSSREKEIPATITFPSEKENPPFVIMCHDLFDEKDEGSGFKRLAKALSNVGIASMRMDFPGCGESSESFQENCLTNMKIDILEGISYMQDNFKVNHEKMGVLGYAMGARALLELLDERAIDPKASLFISPLSNDVDVHNIFEKSGFFQLFEKCKKDPYHMITFKDEHGRKHEISEQFFEDLERNGNKNLLDRVKNSYDGKIHLIYASDDPKISSKSMEEFKKTLECSSLMILSNQHDFGFHEGNINVYQTVEDSVCEFFTKNL